MTGKAAIRVCDLAASRGMLVNRVEGGISRDRGVEMRLDVIWDCKINPPCDATAASTSNAAAARMIEHDDEGCDTFVISLVAIEGKLGRLDG